MVAWYKHDIPAWMDGTEDLDAEPYRAYHVICQLIYLNEGPIALNEHGIAGRCKQSIRTFRAALQTLLELGKLTLSDGRLENSRAEKELENVSENRVNASKGGKKSAEVRKSVSKSLKNNNTDQATLQEDRSLKTRLEETREEDSEANASAPPGGAPVYTDSRHELWGEGVPILVSLGVAEKQSRSMIGSWLKATRDDAQAVLGAIQRARDNRAHNPIPWITNSLKGSTDERNGSVFSNPSSQQSGSASVLAGVAAAAERRARERVAARQQRPESADSDAAGRPDPELFGTG